ncbi:MAG: 30S ribosomal protein S6 [Kiritimatiellales bacterium]|nr:30S ribosomal protein S6 [Kiritimatiellota bacterium]MBL7011774.1 30S ribosomal protein S6 [Kiritimatiellales bacterium]
MKALYEGLFIFPETLDEEQLDQAIDAVKVELEKLGGSLESTTRLGKRSFARPMKKKKAGIYAIIMFHLDGGQIPAFKHRLKLSTNVFRSQFVKKDESDVTQEA